MKNRDMGNPIARSMYSHSCCINTKHTPTQEVGDESIVVFDSKQVAG